MSKHNDNDQMYTGTPCDKCGGPTLQIGQGSIWCPNEDAHPGGHFVVRVAFAQPPKRDAEGRLDWSKQPPKRGPMPGNRRVASEPTSSPVRVSKPADPYATGLDAFIEKES